MRGVRPNFKEGPQMTIVLTCFQAVRLCVTVLHRDTSTTAQLMNMGIGLIGGNKDVHVGLVSFPLSEVAANGIDGWFRLLDEKDGGQVAVPLKKFRVSHRVPHPRFLISFEQRPPLMYFDLT